MSEDLKINKIETNKKNIKVRPLMSAGVIPSHPKRVIVSGPSGSGKTNLFMNLMTRPEFYGKDDNSKHYFDEIYVFSPTGKSDDLMEYLQKKCGIKPENIKTEFSEKDISSIVNKQKSVVESKGIEKSPKVLIVLEDIQADVKFLNSKTLKTLFMMGRHYNCSIWLLGQSYMMTPRSLRLQANNLILFPSKESEQKRIIDEFCPPHNTNKQMGDIIKYATSEPYSFLHINQDLPMDRRYRKNLTSIINHNGVKK